MHSLKEQRPHQHTLERLLARGRQLSDATIMFHQSVADRIGLNPTDHKCLGILMQEGPLTAGQLADRTGLTTGAVTAIIDRLERVGFARREKDPEDRRKVIVRAQAERAKPYLEPIFSVLIERMNEIHNRYTDEELALIEEYMQACIAVMRDLTRGIHGGQIAGDEESRSNR